MDMTPPTEVQYKDLIALSTYIQNIINGMTGMAQRIKALEASNIEIYEILKGLKQAEQSSLTGLQDFFKIVKAQKSEIQALEQAVTKQLEWQLADAQKANRP